MAKFRFGIIIFIMLIVSNSFSQDAKKADDTMGAAADAAEAGAMSYMVGGVFGAVSIDGKNYQQMGLRPEVKIWKIGVGLDINILLDETGKVREDDWNSKEAYLDKLYYVSFGTKGEPFYFKYGGLQSTTLGYGTIINGYTNLLEYPTYKRQGLELSIDTPYTGMEMIVNNFKELSGKNAGVMGGGRIYVKPFSMLQIGGSLAGDLNEYKGLRDSDGDGYPDEVDMYPDDNHYVTERDYYAAKLGIPDVTGSVIEQLVSAGLISKIKKDDLQNFSEKRSKSGFWAADAGLRFVDTEFMKFDVYTQFSQCINTGGWGYTAPGMRITFGSLIELYADYRQQSEEFIFGYYNDTYDLERAKYVDNGTGLSVTTKKEKLRQAVASRGYFAGTKVNILNIITGKLEYQNMEWGKDVILKDKSIKGELALKKGIIPMVSQARAYYVQNNVKELQWKTESTVMGGVVGLGIAEGVSIDFNYLITYEDKNGDGKIKGKDEQISNVSVATSSLF